MVLFLEGGEGLAGDSPHRHIIVRRAWFGQTVVPTCIVFLSDELQR
jgi:hypothetical protein